jgi:hypothetical protein
MGIQAEDLYLRLIGAEVLTAHVGHRRTKRHIAPAVKPQKSLNDEEGRATSPLRGPLVPSNRHRCWAEAVPVLYRYTSQCLTNKTTFSQD